MAAPKVCADDRCRFSNPAGADYCARCGRLLCVDGVEPVRAEKLKCLRGHYSPPHAKYCARCGWSACAPPSAPAEYVTAEGWPDEDEDCPGEIVNQGVSAEPTTYATDYSW